MNEKKRSVLILGAGGMLGHKLLGTLASHFAVVGTVRGGSVPRSPLSEITIRPGVEAMDFDTVRRALADIQPQVVVNCIGIVKQLAAAKESVASITVNALFPHQLAELCQATGIRLIHISTDCVFSGNKGNYTEDDLPDPVDLYGRSKLLGEVSGPVCLTLRTSMIGRELRSPAGLVEWFISQRGGEVQGYGRAIFSGLTTSVLARLIRDIIEHHPDLEGLWHVSADPICKYELLCLINDKMGLNIRVKRQTQYCCDRSLNSDRFRQQVGFCPPSWNEMIDEMSCDTTKCE